MVPAPGRFPGFHSRRSYTPRGYGETAWRSLKLDDGRQELGSSHQIDIVRALCLQFQKNFLQTRFGNIFSKAFAADLVVLAETAAQRAAGKKDGTASVKTADTRFLPWMKRRACRPDTGRAVTPALFFGAVDLTISRTAMAAFVGVGGWFRELDR